jgi:hypothetical protein
MLTWIELRSLNGRIQVDGLEARMSRLAFGKCILATGLVAMFLVPEAFSQGTALNCSDPKVSDKLPKNCKKDLITADGSARPFGWGSTRSAVTNWQREVQRKFGNEFVTWDNAACGTITRSAGGIGVVGGTLKRDTASGYPCTKRDVLSVTTVPGKQLTTDQIKELQTLLTKAGFKTAADGRWGKGTLTALQSWQKSKGQSPIADDAFPDINVLEALKKS